MQKQTEKPSKSIIDRFSQGISDLASALHRREIGWSDLFAATRPIAFFLACLAFVFLLLIPLFLSNNASHLKSYLKYMEGLHALTEAIADQIPFFLAGDLN
jgi:hypothetical protein